MGIRIDLYEQVCHAQPVPLSVMALLLKYAFEKNPFESSLEAQILRIAFIIFSKTKKSCVKIKIKL